MAEPVEIVKKSLLRKTSSDQNLLEYGKLPPQAKELEEAVLGAMLLESECAPEVFRILKEDHFYVDAHQRIFRAMQALFQKNEPIDGLTVVQQLKENGELDAAGGPFFVAQLTNKIGSAANVEHHATIVKECWMKRAVISHCTEMIKSAYDDTEDAFDLVSNSVTGLDNISHEVNANQMKDFATTLISQVDDYRAAAMKPKDERYIIGHRTGIYSLDRKILGYSAPDLIILAARPGEGKTTLAIQGAEANLSIGVPVGFISMEMGMEQLNLKMLSLNTDIPVERIRSGALRSDEWDKINEAQQKMLKYPFHVYDKPCYPEEAKAIAKVWKHKYGIKMLFYDYIQRSKTPKHLLKAMRDQQTGHVSNTLKDIAMELEIPVIACSQMSRDIEKRTGSEKRPQLNDLKDSGTLEADADIVIFPFRPEMHAIKVVKVPGSEIEISSKGVTEIIVEKHRLGAKGAVMARFIGVGNRFTDNLTDKEDIKEKPAGFRPLTNEEKSDAPF